MVIMGEHYTAGQNGKPKQTLRCILFGHKPGVTNLLKCLNSEAARDRELVKQLMQGWGCQRLGCGIDFTQRDPRAEAWVPRFFRWIVRKGS